MKLDKEVLKELDEYLAAFKNFGTYENLVKNVHQMTNESKER